MTSAVEHIERLNANDDRTTGDTEEPVQSVAGAAAPDVTASGVAAGAADLAAGQADTIQVSKPATLKQAFCKYYADNVKAALQQLLTPDQLQDVDARVTQCFKGAGWTQQGTASLLIKHMHDLVAHSSAGDDDSVQSVLDRLGAWAQIVSEWQVSTQAVKQTKAAAGPMRTIKKDSAKDRAMTRYTNAAAKALNDCKNVLDEGEFEFALFWSKKVGEGHRKLHCFTSSGVRGIEEPHLADITSTWQAARTLNSRKQRDAQHLAKTRELQLTDLDLANMKTLAKTMFDLEVCKLSGPRFRMQEGFDAFRKRYPDGDCWWTSAPGNGDQDVAGTSNVSADAQAVGDGVASKARIMDTRAAPPFPHNGVKSMSLTPLRQLVELMLPRADMWQVSVALQQNLAVQLDSYALVFAQQRAEQQSGNACCGDILAPSLISQAPDPAAAQSVGQQDDTDEPLMRPVTRREFAAALLQLDGEAKLPNTLQQALRPTTVGSVQKLELKTPAGEQSCLAEIKHSGQICEALDVFNAVQAVGGSSKLSISKVTRAEVKSNKARRARVLHKLGYDAADGRAIAHDRGVAETIRELDQSADRDVAQAAKQAHAQLLDKAITNLVNLSVVKQLCMVDSPLCKLLHDHVAGASALEDLIGDWAALGTVYADLAPVHPYCATPATLAVFKNMLSPEDRETGERTDFRTSLNDAKTTLKRFCEGSQAGHVEQAMSFAEAIKCFRGGGLAHQGQDWTQLHWSLWYLHLQAHEQSLRREKLARSGALMPAQAPSASNEHDAALQPCSATDATATASTAVPPLQDSAHVQHAGAISEPASFAVQTAELLPCDLPHAQVSASSQLARTPPPPLSLPQPQQQEQQLRPGALGAENMLVDERPPFKVLESEAVTKLFNVAKGLADRGLYGQQVAKGTPILPDVLRQPQRRQRCNAKRHALELSDDESADAAADRIGSEDEHNVMFADAVAGVAPCADAPGVRGQSDPVQTGSAPDVDPEAVPTTSFGAVLQEQPRADGSSRPVRKRPKQMSDCLTGAELADLDMDENMR